MPFLINTYVISTNLEKLILLPIDLYLTWSIAVFKTSLLNIKSTIIHFETQVSIYPIPHANTNLVAHIIVCLNDNSWGVPLL